MYRQVSLGHAQTFFSFVFAILQIRVWRLQSSGQRWQEEYLRYGQCSMWQRHWRSVVPLHRSRRLKDARVTTKWIHVWHACTGVAEWTTSICCRGKGAQITFLTTVKFFFWVIHMNEFKTPFGGKLFLGICQRTLFVPRSEWFSKSEALGKLWTSDNRWCRRICKRAHL